MEKLSNKKKALSFSFFKERKLVQKVLENPHVFTYISKRVLNSLIHENISQVHFIFQSSEPHDWVYSGTPDSITKECNLLLDGIYISSSAYSSFLRIEYIVRNGKINHIGGNELNYPPTPRVFYL